MRYLLGAAMLALVSWLNFSPSPETPLVVHEWGTFTSFSDSQGELIEFRPLIANRLPEFVFDRTRQNGMIDLARALTKSEVWSKQRMETPVTYFYTDRARDVRVSVDFPQGFLTEFYPPVRDIRPKAHDENWSMTNARLDWGQVRLIPEAEFDRTLGAEARREGRSLIPRVTGDDHYGHARATDSAIVEFADPTGHGTHYEKFLFYRGLGNFDQPAKLTA